MRVSCRHALFAALWSVCAFSFAPASVFVFVSVSQAQDRAALPDGNYLLWSIPNAIRENRVAILKVATEGGKTTATVLNSGSVPAKVVDFSVNRNTVVFSIEQFGQKTRFEGIAAPNDPKTVLGAIELGSKMQKAKLVSTDMTELTQENMFVVAKPPEAVVEYQKLFQPVNELLRKASLARTQAERDRLLQQRTALREKILKEESPKLYRRVIEQSPNDPYAVFAAEALLAQPDPNATQKELAAWVKIVEDDVRPYNPRLLKSTQIRLAGLLAGQSQAGELGLRYAQFALDNAGMSATQRSIALKMKVSALKSAGKTKEIASAKAELEQIEQMNDAQYQHLIPSFEGQPYAGRRDRKANRVAVMELFTGAQCLPSIAADLAFNALTQKYGPKDAVFLQYHEHIPSPDPLANPDSVARMEYYGELFPDDVNGVPLTIFNGSLQEFGGGQLTDSEERYQEFRQVLDQALEQSTPIKLAGSAQRSGDKVTVNVVASGLKDPTSRTKLRLLLTESKVRFTGSNNVRLHHHVVRSMFGMPEGISVTNLKDGKHSATLNLQELQDQWNRYLDEYAKIERFLQFDRPFEFAKLKVVALVQDDKTGEVLQAAEMEVAGQQSPRKP